jgi:hypothetical protein
LYQETSTTAYLSLVLSDWSGDSHYEREKFFKSLQIHHHDKQKCELRFENGSQDITINISDIVKVDELVEVEAPEQLFHHSRRRLQTSALYYDNETLYRIGNKQIGRVKGLPVKDKACVQDICSIRLQGGEGDFIYRVFHRCKKAKRLINDTIVTVGDRIWMRNWRLAEKGEREWWSEME